jgi:hypothetical protein
MSTKHGPYDPKPDYTKYYQGDILRDVAFPTWLTSLPATERDKWGVLRPNRSGNLSRAASMKQFPVYLVGRAQTDVPDAFDDMDLGEWVIARMYIKNVMLVTRSCALDNPARKNVTVAPLVALDDLPEEQRKHDIVQSVRLGEVPHRFYLPAVGGMPDSYADLLRLTSIHRTFLPNNGVSQKVVARLSSEGTHSLQRRLSEHFGEKFGFDFEDRCEQDGYYRCSSCFYLGSTAPLLKFDAGSEFGVCGTCGDAASWVKMPR